jgi:hypothetical protein
MSIRLSTGTSTAAAATGEAHFYEPFKQDTLRPNYFGESTNPLSRLQFIDLPNKSSVPHRVRAVTDPHMTTRIIPMVGNPGKFALVCKHWRNYSNQSYTFVLDACRNNRLFKLFKMNVPKVFAGTKKDQIKQVFQQIVQSARASMHTLSGWYNYRCEDLCRDLLGTVNVWFLETNKSSDSWYHDAYTICCDDKEIMECLHKIAEIPGFLQLNLIMQKVFKCLNKRIANKGAELFLDNPKSPQRTVEEVVGTEKIENLRNNKQAMSYFMNWQLRGKMTEIMTKAKIGFSIFLALNHTPTNKLLPYIDLLPKTTPRYLASGAGRPTGLPSNASETAAAGTGPGSAGSYAPAKKQKIG